MARSRVIFPDFSIGTVTQEPYDVISDAVLKAKQEIMAAEDESIFAVIDKLGRYCNDQNHLGHGGPISDCSHPDCIARSIHES